MGDFAFVLFTKIQTIDPQPWRFSQWLCVEALDVHFNGYLKSVSACPLYY
jgi:hypothetical protein